MKKIYFKNKGEINPISICTFGVNCKDTENPIGYFGTGLKYAIAIILREGGGITIFNGKEKFAFSVKKETIREKDFNIVEMNGAPLGFTTELGKNWELWQAFRELYCNATDENGDVTDKKTKPAKDNVLIEVDLDKFYDCYNNINDFVLNTKPYITGTACDIHKGNNNKVFYKNILIHKSREETLYTYNIKSSLEITEDRTAAHGWQIKERIANALISTKKESVAFNVIHAGKGTLEASLDFDYDATLEPSEVFLDVAEAEYKKQTANKSLVKVLSKYRELPELEEIKLNDVNKAMLDRAVSFCVKIGYEVTSYQLVVTGGLTSGVMGQAKNNKMYISIETFGMGTKYLSATIIEEFLHLKTGYSDMTRELQNYLFNDIVSFGEQIIGEPV